ncbi:MAG: hypothetical protein M3527_03905, partial [Actinomycetota bacterium]|nr:hypothetical protein [Actinomycetota bacterium]
VDAMLTAGLTTHDGIVAAVRRIAPVPGRKGVPALLSALEVWAPGLTHDSVAEARLFRLLRQWGFPTPAALYPIRDRTGTVVGEADAAWPALLVALDYDSARHHGPRRDEVDERRHAAAEALGWTFVSVDKLDLRPGGQARFRAEVGRLLRRAA